MEQKENEIVELIKKDDKEGLSKFEKTDLKEMIIKELEVKFSDRRDDKEDSASLLHVAAINNAIKCFDYLLNDVQIPLNSKSEKGFLPIHYSLQFGLYEISSHILSIYKNNYSNPENTLENLFSQDYVNTNLALNLLYNCISTNDYEGLTHLLDLLFTFGYDLNKIKSTRIKEVIIRIFVPTFKDGSTLRFFELFTPLQGYERFTILHNCIATKNNSLLEELIKSGWDVNFIDKGETLLYYACFQNSEKAVEILLKYMDQIDPPNAEIPAVCSLCVSRNPNIARMILSKNIDVHRLDKNGHFGPYHLCGGEEKDNLTILSMLCDHGYDLNFKDRNGTSLIEVFLTSIKIQYSIIEWLIQHGADLNSIMQPKGKGKEMSVKQHIVRLSKHNTLFANIVQKFPQIFSLQ